MTRGYLVRSLFCLALMTSASAARAQLATGFSYQGRLTNQAAPVSGTCAFTFTVWNMATGGAQVAGPVQQSLAVGGGLFSTILDFGSGPFVGGIPRWLNVAVDCGGGLTNLPRQQITAAPLAVNSINTLSLQGVPITP